MMLQIFLLTVESQVNYMAVDLNSGLNRNWCLELEDGVC
jgi:hypothetical protein